MNVPAKNISELFQGVSDQKGHHHEWSLQLNLVFGRFLDFYFLPEAEVYKQGMSVCVFVCVCVRLRMKALRDYVWENPTHGRYIDVSGR